MRYSVVVNGVIIDGEGRVLIAKRHSEDDHEPGMWTTPGGKVEEDLERFKVLEQALKREIMEEVGIKIKDEIHLIVNNVFKKSDGSNTLSLVFLCTYKSGLAKPLDETDEVAWVSEQEVHSYSFPENVKEYVEKGFEVRGKL